MHCKFEDVESGRAFEVDFSLDENGKISETDKGKKGKRLELIKVE
jgi:hypothetical protein